MWTTRRSWIDDIKKWIKLTDYSMKKVRAEDRESSKISGRHRRIEKNRTALAAMSHLQPCLNPARSEERCKLLQWGLGQSPSRNQIWCIVALKSDIWWQQL